MSGFVATADAIVVGGGLHGCSAALHLARAGVRAIVLEKNYVGRHASGVNAGGVRTLSRHEAEVPLALAALDMWYAIGELVDDDCGFESNGQVRIAEDERDAAALKAREARMRGLGYAHERWIDAAELLARVPAIAPHCLGGLLAERDGAADPYRTTAAFRRKAEALGQRIHEGVRVERVQRVGNAWSVATDQGAFGARALVNCAGAWADRICAALGEPVPLEPIAPMMMVTLRLPPFLQPVVLGAARPLSFKQTGAGTVLIGGGRRARVDRDAETTKLDFRELAASARTVCDLFPIMRSAVVNRAWAGIEARMPDDIPVISRSSTTRDAYHAFGFSAHGFELGPIVGRIVAELVTTGGTPLPIAPFAIERFGPR
ncbi:MAG TPA: FAD-dependent oxidoreductase [Casimicrobiaceae bacterium]|nr:FAD-dependent oxidoreductase [Casimicrobiaceae bacterium]